MNTIDLHIHTNFSDGSFSPEVILQKAETAGIKILSITDHDNVEFYTEWLKTNRLKDYFSGELICGVELTTIVNGVMIEFLGYNIDAKIVARELKKNNANFLDFRKKEFLKILETFNRNGFELSTDDFSDTVLKHGGITDILNKILFDKKFENHPKKKFIEDNRKMFFREHLTNPNSNYFTDFAPVLLTPQKAFNIIKKAGGQVFIAHPGIYTNYIDIFNHVIKNYKIDGIECFHPKLTQEQQEFFKNFALKNKYLISGGSDYHYDKRSLIGGTDFDVKLVEGVIKAKWKIKV